MTGKILILGMGNTLLGDEGVGVHTVRTLQNAQTALGNIEVIDGGTLSFVLAGPIEDAACLIVVDAAQLSRAPGTVRETAACTRSACRTCWSSPTCRTACPRGAR